VPKDLELKNGQETFQVQVAYDTLELYGKINATREITIGLK